jgi:nicotinamide-nucleotide amidase
MHVRIVTIGDELLLGQTVNSNATWMAQQLSSVQLAPEEVTVIADASDAIQGQLDRFWERDTFIIMTGGLGPTADDVTKSAVAEYLERSLSFDRGVYEQIVQRLKSRGIPITDVNRELAMVPDGFEVLSNTSGTAPGLWYEEEHRVLVLLPGVPYEMKTLMRAHVLPRLEERVEVAHTFRVLRTVGISESTLHDRLDELNRHTGGVVRVAFLPELGGVRLRLTARGSNRDRLDRVEQYIREQIGHHLYSVEDEELEVVVGTLLEARALTIAVAESCTGGAVASRLTDVPGASGYVEGGMVAYSNRVKVEQLGVSSEALENEGAVSSTVARQMAEGIRARMGTDIGISTTGVAGPSGGTAEKPVGTVWIGYADAEGAKARQLSLTQDRIVNKELSVVAVLDMVRRRLISQLEGS